jgi:hypothetical protein
LFKPFFIFQRQHEEEGDPAKVSFPATKVTDPEVGSLPDAKEAFKESEELVVHFVSSPEKFEDPALANFKRSEQSFLIF